MAEVQLSFEDLMPVDLAGRSFPACGVTLSARNKFVRNTASGGVIKFKFDAPSKVGDLVLINCTAGGMVWVFNHQDEIVETVGLPAAPHDTTTTVSFGMPGIARMDVRLAGEGAIDQLSFEVDDAVIASSSDCRPRRHRGRSRRKAGGLQKVTSNRAQTMMPRALARPKGALNLVYDVDDETVGGRADMTEKQRETGNMAGNSTRVDDGGNEIPCFVSGTSIATARGEILIEDLKVGDAVVTRDNGIQKIRWIGSRRISPKQMEEHPHLKPILIEKGSLGNGLPDRHLMLSPNHRLLVNTDRVSLHYRDPEALISAKHLINPSRGVRPIAITGTTYFHLMFDQHQVILSNGAWTESFRPSDRSLKAVGNAQRTEIFELFPGLQGTEGRKNYAPARPDLKTDRAALVLFK